jgi:hypothetical protein
LQSLQKERRRVLNLLSVSSQRNKYIRSFELVPQHDSPTFFYPSRAACRMNFRGRIGAVLALNTPLFRGFSGNNLHRFRGRNFADGLFLAFIQVAMIAKVSMIVRVSSKIEQV